MGGGTRGDRPSYARAGSNSNSSLGRYVQTGKKRVFISFYMDDEAQVDLLRHQAKDERFDLEFSDYSVKEPFDEKWRTQCTPRLQQSDVLLVMIGKETYQREAVLWEINKAYELGILVIGVRIHKDANDPIPEPMRQNGARIVNWNMEEIQNAINEAEA